MVREARISHVCLAGCKVTTDWSLIRRLKFRHAVTLVEAVEVLPGTPLLDTTSVLVLDCTDCDERVRDLLPALKEQFPDLCVVLVEGDHSRQEVAGAFRDGVRDYFPAPYDVQLLAERVTSLCGRPVPPA